MSQRVLRTSIGCALACGAFLTVPLSAGAGIAKADLVGVGGGNSGGIDVLGVHVLSTDRTKGSGVAGSSSRINAVSTAPSAQTVVIRSAAPAAQDAVPQDVPADIPASTPAAYEPAEASSARAADVIAAAPAAPPPAAVDLPPSLPMPAAPAWPQAALVPSTSAPRPESPLGPGTSSGQPTKVPDNFRVGYAEYLRSATNTDLLVAAVPGVAGIAGFTLIGAYAGYRQARALQRALLAPVPTSFLL